MVAAKDFVGAERIRPQDAVEAAEWSAEALGTTSRGAQVNATEFVNGLGTFPSGVAPRYSGTVSENFDSMWGAREIQPPEPPPALKASWRALVARTIDETRDRVKSTRSLVWWRQQRDSAKVYVVRAKAVARHRVRESLIGWVLK